MLLSTTDPERRRAILTVADHAPDITLDDSVSVNVLRPGDVFILSPALYRNHIGVAIVSHPDGYSDVDWIG